MPKHRTVESNPDGWGITWPPVGSFSWPRSTPLAGPPEIGPPVMRASTILENGSEEHVDVATQAHAGAGRSQAERSRPAAERGARAAGGAQASGDRRGDLSPVAESVRRDEGRRREAAEG